MDDVGVFIFCRLGGFKSFPSSFLSDVRPFANSEIGTRPFVSPDCHSPEGFRVPLNDLILSAAV